jgi:acyl-CoA synthetase (AMP-forming)/AMP-acid ligase II
MYSNNRDANSDLLRLLARRVRSEPGRPAVLADEPLTWADLAARVDLAAGALTAHGVRAEMPLVLAVDGPAAGIVGILAAARLGAVVSPMATAVLAAVRADPSRADVLDGVVVLTDDAALLAGAGAGAGVLLGRDGSAPAGTPTSVAPAVRPSARSQRVVLTHPRSIRTLGQRAVGRRHCQLVTEGIAVAAALRIDAHDDLLVLAGIDTSLGLAMGVLVPLATGARLVDPRTGPAGRATVVAAGSDWYRALAERPRGANPLEAARWCLTDDVVPREVAAALAGRTGVRVRRTYGRPESGLALVDLGSRSFHDPSSVGVGISGARVRVVDAAGRDCAEGAIGEIVVSARWLADEADVVPGDRGERVEHGELFTAERGCFDAGGNLLVIRGRRTERRLPPPAPAAVEAVLSRHPGVAAVKVAAVSTPRGACVLKAVVVTEGRCDRRELVGWCRRHLRETDIPTLIEFRHELPAVVAAPAASVEVGAAHELGLPPVAAPATSPVPAGGSDLTADPLAARLTG